MKKMSKPITKEKKKKLKRCDNLFTKNILKFPKKYKKAEKSTFKKTLKVLNISILLAIHF